VHLVGITYKFIKMHGPININDSWCSLYECMNVTGYNASQKIGVCKKGFKVFKTVFIGFRYQFRYQISNL